ncbi:MAG TPA: RcnB family protein [Sphingomicrobium sp.]|jgi:Ni/Co efflux regulator RcnB|nr:RcnB family protein [Sphingomicrobium sp.]
MKKLMLAAAGAAVALSPIAATPALARDFNGHNFNRHVQVQKRNVVKKRIVKNRYVQNRYVHNRYVQQRHWRQGERFDYRYAPNYRVISNPYYYNLRPAPYGYRWVQSGNDAVLIAITSGIIGAIIGNAL